MRLNTARCGCGQIVTLPNLKARLGPCMHAPRAPLGDECGRWVLHVSLAPWAFSLHEGWTVEGRVRLDACGRKWIDLQATKGKHTVRYSYLASERHYRGPALNTLADLARRHDRLPGRAAAFLVALSGLAGQIVVEQGVIKPYRDYRCRSTHLGHGLEQVLRACLPEGSSVDVTEHPPHTLDVDIRAVRLNATDRAWVYNFCKQHCSVGTDLHLTVNGYAVR